MNKKKIIILVIIFLAIGLAVGGYFWWKKKKDEGAESEIPEVPEPIEPPPAGTSSWKDESFPLKKGMFGGQIKLLQQKLGLSADGRFGPGTEKAVLAKIGKPEVDKPAYDRLMGKNMFERGSKPVATKSAGPIYSSMPGTAGSRVLMSTTAGSTHGTLKRVVADKWMELDSGWVDKKYFV